MTGEPQIRRALPLQVGPDQKSTPNRSNYSAATGGWIAPRATKRGGGCQGGCDPASAAHGASSGRGPVSESSRSISDASATVESLCQSEGERLDSELSMIRYIVWAIPSIGFIGTVRGIGQALALAYQAMEGDITGVTQSLGVAFNSTFVALLLSLVLMFFVHQLQLLQERLVLDTQDYCGTRLIRHMEVGPNDPV